MSRAFNAAGFSSLKAATSTPKTELLIQFNRCLHVSGMFCEPHVAGHNRTLSIGRFLKGTSRGFAMTHRQFKRSFHGQNSHFQGTNGFRSEFKGTPSNVDSGFSALRTGRSRSPLGLEANPSSAVRLKYSNSRSVKAESSTTHFEGNDSGYRLPPNEILEIVDAPPTPALSFSPQRDKLLFLHRPSLTPVSELARPELKLAGLRIDPECNSRSRMSFYSGVSICKLLEDDTLGESVDIVNLPEGAKINFLSWSPNGRNLAFTVRTDDEDGGSRSMLGLWIADVATGQARPLLIPPEHSLNTVFDSYSWVDDSTLVVCTIPSGRGPAPVKPRTPGGPVMQSNERGVKAQARTYQDLLKDTHDEKTFEYYATSQLLLVGLDGSWKTLGEPKMYTAVEPSYDGQYLLVATMERPFSFLVPCGRFPKRVQVWRLDGSVAQDVASLPLAENIPITFNSVRPGKRSINWRADRPSMLYWVETQDGGDARVEVVPRDIVYSYPAEPSPGEEPQVVHKLDLRYGGISWGDDELALVYESWWKTRRTRTWAIAPGALEKEPHLLFDLSSEDRYSNPGSPMQRRTKWGSYVLARVSTADGRQKLLLDGDGATPEGEIPFLDLLDVETGETERIWQSDKEKVFESVISLMSDSTEGPLPLESLRILTSRETQQENPQYFLCRWPDQSLVKITDFPHPYPSIRGVTKEIIRYERSDGVQLTATLYLPPGYDAERDGPLPLLMWAYPREYKSKDAAGQMRGSSNQFASIGATSERLFLARGFAVLSGPSMPIIGEGEEEANDRFVEQLVSSAEAAVDEVVRRGVADRQRIAIGGHSYGAFMTANLLAHAPNLFCCGIAESGAYNRTFTPFGFQSEERTLWEVPEVYMKMSPFMLANVITSPMLLIHGEDDNNPGTFPMQSERFFAALKGHGAECRLVILPHEGHGYRGRESILHKLAEISDWLELYCGGAPKAAVAPLESDAKQQEQIVAVGRL